MAFLALASQKSVLALQKNFLQLQYISISNQEQYAAAQMAEVQKEYTSSSSSSSSSSDYTDDATYIYYEQLDEQLQTEKDSIDSQLTEIENEISSLKTLVNNNIKSSCTLNLSTGS
jgi:hypothetical protein